MEDTSPEVVWEALEYPHIEKNNDWYWALGILAIAGAAAAFVSGNVLFGVVILLGAATMALHSLRPPRVITYAITARGIHIGTRTYPFNTLASYCLNESDLRGPQLIVKPAQLFITYLILPVPEEELDAVETLLQKRLAAEELEEPLSHRVLEFFGF